MQVTTIKCDYCDRVVERAGASTVLLRDVHFQTVNGPMLRTNLEISVTPDCAFNDICHKCIAAAALGALGRKDLEERT